MPLGRWLKPHANAERRLALGRSSPVITCRRLETLVRPTRWPLGSTQMCLLLAPLRACRICRVWPRRVRCSRRGGWAASGSRFSRLRRLGRIGFGRSADRSPPCVTSPPAALPPAPPPPTWRPGRTSSLSAPLSPTPPTTTDSQSFCANTPPPPDPTAQDRTPHTARPTRAHPGVLRQAGESHSALRGSK